MKKLLVLSLVVLLVISTLGLAKANEKEHQSNGQPFQEIWDYLGDPEQWIESFFDVFVQIPDYEEDMETLNARIDELGARLDACGCGTDPEICDGIDNDGDGEIDEGFNVMMPCDGPDIDLCASGVTVCSIDGLGVECIDDIPNFIELCDGFDNDCNPATDDGIDEPWLETPCDGIDSDLCEEGTYTCDSGSQTCTDNTGSDTDICNGLDDDCDPSSADGSEDPSLGTSCDTGMPGVCAAGTTHCTAGSLQCQQDQYPSPEICNGLDDDCDGDVDEGLQC